MATVYDKSSLFLAPSGVNNGTVFVQKPVPIYGSEQVTNGDFSQEGAEIADNNTISNAGGSIITKTSALNYNATSDGTGGSSIRPKLAFDGATSGKSYVIRITPTNQSGLIEFKLYDGSSYVIDNSNLSTYLEFYFKYDGASTFLAFDGTNAFNVDFEISLKEVGQDWTLTVPEITIGESEVNFNSVANASSIRQYDALTVGKIYKATYTISNYSLGGAKIRIGGVQGTQRQANGTYTEYITATLDTSVRVYAVSTTSLSITNISVQEVLSPAGDFTFTRGSNLSATRVNEAQLIEKGRENLLLQSNQFDTTWTTRDASVTSGQSGYDGSNDAWLLEKSGNSGLLQQIISGSNVSTLSVYIKAGSLNWAWFILRDSGGGDDAEVYINLTDGSLGSSGGGAFINATTEDAGSGWYRCSIVNSGGYDMARIAPADGNGNLSGTSGSIYIQDAQLEQGLAATSVITTGAGTVQAGLLENTPRLDYSGGATCPSLLLEPSRTQYIPQTEYLEGLGGDAGLNFNYNDATSPEGLTNAVQVVSNNTAQSYVGYFNGTTPAGDNAFSVFAKYDNCQYICIRILSFTGGDDGYYWFDIQNGTKGSKSGSTITYDIEDYGNGWYRCFLVHNVDAADLSGAGRVYLSDSDSSLNSALNQSAHLYGLQWEAGSYISSYIPNHSGGTITRAVDDLTSTPLSINGLFGATSGSIFMEFANPLQSLSNNWFYMTGQPAGGSGASMRVRGYWQMNMPGLTWNPTPNLGSLNNATKVAVKWGGGVAKLFIDGSEDAASTYTGGDINMDGTLQGLNGSFNFAKNNANFKQILFFQEALSDTECIKLTTI